MNKISRTLALYSWALFILACSGNNSGNEAGAAGQRGNSGIESSCVSTSAGCPDLDFVPIEGGTFQMGNDEDNYAQPIHSVTVPGFEMMRTEVTVAQYRVCVDAGVCQAPRIGNYVANLNDHPMHFVSWYDAQTFAAFVGARLPSEAEWEYAARSGGQNITHPWGNEAPDCSRLNFNRCVGTTTPTCTYPTGNTTQGLCDMGGNVVEWVEDDFHSAYTDAPNDGSPWIDNPRDRARGLRGGSYASSAGDVRATYRNRTDPSTGFGNPGFRLARSAR